MNRHRCECSICAARGAEIERIQADFQELAQENDTLARTVVLLRAEIDRLQEAKRAALKIADERAKEANGLRQQKERMRKALQQIITICGDNAGHNARHDMALRFVREVANAAYPDESGT